MDEVRSHVCLDLPSLDGKADPKIVPLILESHTGRALAPSPKRSTSPQATSTLEWLDSLKALDPNRPIREVDMRWTSVQLDFDHCSLHRHVVLRALLVTFGKETEVNTWISRSLLLGILSSVCGVTIASARAAGSRRGADWPHS